MQKDSRKQYKISSINFTGVFKDSKGDIIEGEGIVKQKQICIRPHVVAHVPVIYCEEKYDKLLCHNYCYGGYGYTVQFGGIRESIEKFKAKLQSNPSQSLNSICVVGAGIIGLLTAVTLHHEGFKNITVIGKCEKRSPSYIAGGLFELVYKNDDNEEANIKLNNFCKETFFEYKKIVEGTHPFLSKGVRWVKYFTDTISEKVGLGSLAKDGVLELEKVDLCIGSDSNVIKNIFAIDSFSINTHIIMEHLFDLLKKCKINFIEKQVKSLSEIESDVIFNCSGIGARILNDDYKVFPVAGHGIELNLPNTSDMNYIIKLYGKTFAPNNPKFENSCFYIMPRVTGFMGGTFLPHYSGSDKKYNEQKWDLILEQAQILYGNIKQPKF